MHVEKVEGRRVIDSKLVKQIGEEQESTSWRTNEGRYRRGERTVDECLLAREVRCP